MITDEGRKNCLELANFIEKAEYQFDMGDDLAAPKCGSAGCIGGHAAVLWSDVRQEGYDDSDTYFSWNDVLLANKLGVDVGVADRLCFTPRSANGDELDYAQVTRPVAVAAIRRLAETGDVAFDPADHKEDA